MSALSNQHIQQSGASRASRAVRSQKVLTPPDAEKVATVARISSIVEDPSQTGIRRAGELSPEGWVAGEGSRGGTFWEKWLRKRSRSIQERRNEQVETREDEEKTREKSRGLSAKSEVSWISQLEPRNR